MSIIRKFILKDVRCFEGKNEFNIRPLTFLVGENSTGKSTVLGCFQALNNFMTDMLEDIDFNQEPYQMGAFADIARKTRSIARSFELGFEHGKIQYILTLVAREDGSEPIIQQIKNIFEDGELIIKAERIKNGKSLYKKREFNIKEPEKNKFIFSIKDSSRLNRNPYLFSTGFILRVIERELQGKELSSAQKNLIAYLKKIIKREYPDLEGISYSFAPIRSKPERTYNPLKETVSPEGSEMPMVLMNLSKSNEREWQQLKDGLKKFGKASGLFTDIGVRKLGRSANDPFQLQIKVRGPKGNLMDVGYGVNQILPILVRIILTRHGRFLLQQPEVHLHPKGQAELTSLLSDLTKEEKYFIVETHSDAMIDRARIEIMGGILEPEDVSLIYLEPVGNKVKLHNISFDKQANMIDAPDSYREFFLKEGDRLLGFED